MNNSKTINTLLTELSTRRGVISTEIDDFSNPLHILRLRQLLGEYDIPTDIIDENMMYLTEEVPDRVKKQAKKLGLVWKRVGYGKEGEKGITHKVEDDKLVPVGDDKKTSDKTSGSGETPPEKKKVTQIDNNPFSNDPGTDDYEDFEKSKKYLRI